MIRVHKVSGDVAGNPNSGIAIGDSPLSSDPKCVLVLTCSFRKRSADELTGQDWRDRYRPANFPVETRSFYDFV